VGERRCACRPGLTPETQRNGRRAGGPRPGCYGVGGHDRPTGVAGGNGLLRRALHRMEQVPGRAVSGAGANMSGTSPIRTVANLGQPASPR